MSFEFDGKLAELSRDRVEASVLLKGMLSGTDSESTNAAVKLNKDAAKYGLNLRDYLTLKIDPELGDKGELYGSRGANLNGYEVALVELGLPIKDDFKSGITIQAASDTFMTHPGTRALFPEVIDDMIKWDYRQEQIEKVDTIVSNSRTINGTELLSSVVTDQQDDYNFTQPISESANIPTRKIVMGEQSVKIWKHGSGLEWSYEFARRASIDILKPYAARIAREQQISKMAAATGLIVNGDSIYGAAPVVNQSTLKPAGASTSVIGTINWESFLAWLVSRAEAGTPVDTVVGNWDMYLQWKLLFARPTINAGLSQNEILQKAGVQAAVANPNLDFNISFAVSSSAPATKLIGFSKADTLEELIEANSNIEESEKAIKNQTVKMVRTQNAGYRLVFGDTRSILNLDAVT